MGESLNFPKFINEELSSRQIEMHNRCQCMVLVGWWWWYKDIRAREKFILQIGLFHHFLPQMIQKLPAKTFLCCSFSEYAIW